MLPRVAQIQRRTSISNGWLLYSTRLVETGRTDLVIRHARATSGRASARALEPTDLTRRLMTERAGRDDRTCRALRPVTPSHPCVACI